jgi:hypothetical protein
MYDLVSVADPGSGALLTPGWGGEKSGSGSGIRNKHPRSFSESLETVFWVKNTYIEKFAESRT